MKKVFSSISEAIHIFANQPEREGRASSVSFHDGKLYSYRTVIAQHVIGANGEAAIILNNTSYSNTTSKQQGAIHFAACHIKRLYIRGVGFGCECLKPYSAENWRGLDVKKLIATYEREAADFLAKASRARNNAENYRAAAFNTLTELTEYLAFFGIQYETGDLSALEAAAIEAAKRSRELEKARKAERIREQAEALEKWRSGENVYRSFEVTALRINGNEIETSRGAKIPVEHAIKAWPMLKRLHNGGADVDLSENSIKFGVYSMRAFKNDSLIVGCHTIPFVEVQGIANQLSLN
jgi:hypothetical protein